MWGGKFVLFKLLISGLKITKKHFLVIMGTSLFITLINFIHLNEKFILIFFSIYALLIGIQNAYMLTQKYKGYILYKVLPIADNKVVLSKYILGILDLLIAYILALFFFFINSIFTKKEIIVDYKSSLIFAILISLILASIIIPINLYGKNVALISSGYGLIGGIIGLLSGGMKITSKISSLYINFISKFNIGINIGCMIIILLVIMMYFLSYLISIKVYRRKYIN